MLYSYPASISQKNKDIFLSMKDMSPNAKGIPLIIDKV